MKISHSEETARKKWCPFVRRATQLADNSVSSNREWESEAGYDCIASDCMAWRWVETHIKDEGGDLTVMSGDTHGYCGLAGVPGS